MLEELSVNDDANQTNFAAGTILHTRSEAKQSQRYLNKITKHCLGKGTHFCPSQMACKIGPTRSGSGHFAGIPKKLAPPPGSS